MNNITEPAFKLAKRFRGFLPVVIDIETGGFNSATDAVLEIAAVILKMDDTGKLLPEQTVACHVLPFPGANIEPASLEVNHIDPYHPFRFAISECEALEKIFQSIRQAMQETKCERAILVGHNANFDLRFLRAAVKRCDIKDDPLHKFSVFDTATLAGLAFGETVLVRAVKAAGLEFDVNQAHSAIYDAEKTAELFCLIVNRWRELGGWK